MKTMKIGAGLTKAVIFLLLGIVFGAFSSACGPGTFLGTWSDILSNDENQRHPSSGKNKGDGSLPERESAVRQIKKLDFIKIFGVQNRERGLLMIDNNAKIGFSVTSGDINGDQIDDIILGAPESEGILPETSRSGWVYVVLGRKNLPGKIDLGKYADVALWGGEEAGHNLFGHSVVSSDLNGDGVLDLIIGVPYGNHRANNRIHSGIVYVVFGGKTLKGIIDLSKHADITILGTDDGDLAGFSLAAGDINGDNLSDLIIGAPGGDGYQEKTPDAGETYIIYGRNKFPKVIDLSKHWNSRIFGVESRSSVALLAEDEPDKSGYAVATSDLNDDGVDDVIIGAPFADGFLNRDLDAGESYVIFGRKKMPKNIRLSKQTDITLYGARRGDHSGQALIKGDINGDKIDDLIMSSPGASRKTKNGSFNGLLHTVFGKGSHPKEYHLKTNSSRLFKSPSTDPCEHHSFSSTGGDSLRFGRSFTTLDLNQDGRDDLVVGAPCAQGQTGKSRSGEISFFLAREHQRLASSTAVFQPEKTKSNEYFGFSVSRGDINGDGRMDILVGAPGMPRTKGLSASGGAYVILGLSPK